MTGDPSARPTARDAAQIVRDVLGEEPETLTRFPTGLCHYVFDVQTRSGRRAVVRIAEPANRHYLQGAVYWSGMLRPRGVPLPELLDADLDGRSSPFPYMLLERLNGTDLGHRYADLSEAQRRSIASRVVELQRLVGTLPEGNGFGHSTRYDGTPYRHWSHAIAGSLDRSTRWIAGAGVVSPAAVERVRHAALGFEAYFAAVRPVPFLDDTTTKNVIVDDDGRLSGIVDVDEVCFGDPLLTPALTRMALISSGHDTDYVDYWCEALELDRSRRRVLTFYTALFCVSFLGELGQRFNTDAPGTVDRTKVADLTATLDRLLAELDSH